MNKQTVIVLDFGGQYNQLIARRVREADVYCQILPYSASIDRIKSLNPSGIIFTGGPKSVTEADSPTYDKEIFELGIPILGICYGMQLMTHILGGSVEKPENREYGKVEIEICNNNILNEGVATKEFCWMSHTDYVSKLPEGFVNTAFTADCPNASMANDEKKLYGVQYHPEVVHTPFGNTILGNFLYKVCGCTGDWKMSTFVEEQIQSIKEKVGNKKVLCALSGGVDSSVCAVLINKAIGKQLTCVFVDHGLLRKYEFEQVQEYFTTEYDINLVAIDARDRFLDKLAGVTEPEEKRKIIGEEFIRVFEDYSKEMGKVDFLVQGTIYPDIIESGVGDAAVIKSHHNVGGLPSVISFEEIIEPLKDLFKDEVRKVGEELGMPHDMVWRQPFPGPGLGIRVIGEITRDKLEILRNADYVFRDEVKRAGLDKDINQYFVVLTNMRTVGVMGDERTYDYVVALRAVTTEDFMTADWAKIPYDMLERLSARIINEVGHINRVVYDITTKPPGTVEWE